eukprot:4102870-Pyramimonas_sp.AAC.1
MAQAVARLPREPRNIPLYASFCYGTVQFTFRFGLDLGRARGLEQPNLLMCNHAQLDCENRRRLPRRYNRT